MGNAIAWQHLDDELFVRRDPYEVPLGHTVIIESGWVYCLNPRDNRCSGQCKASP